nr:hypothetical protein [Brucella pituitosa]
MTEIDIDSLDEATLMALNRRIVERLQYLHQQKDGFSVAGYQDRQRRDVYRAGWSRKSGLCSALQS